MSNVHTEEEANAREKKRVQSASSEGIHLSRRIELFGWSKSSAVGPGDQIRMLYRVHLFNRRSG
jgi:hypothetical protein